MIKTKWILYISIFALFLILASLFSNIDRPDIEIPDRSTTTTTIADIDTEVVEDKEEVYYKPDANIKKLNGYGYTYMGSFPEGVAKNIVNNYDNSVVYNYYGQWRVWVK